MPTDNFSTPEKIRKWLLDVQQAVVAIQHFFADVENFNQYKDNLMLKRATERELEIIGEAVNRIVKAQPNILISDKKKIVGLRNYIIHVYDNVSDEIVWGIVVKNLPTLRREVDELLRTDYTGETP